MFLGEKDPDHKPPGKVFFCRLRDVGFWLLVIAVIFSSKLSLAIGVIFASALAAYYVYLLATKQTYFQFLRSKKRKNEQKVAGYRSE